MIKILLLYLALKVIAIVVAVFAMYLFHSLFKKY